MSNDKPTIEELLYRTLSKLSTEQMAIATKLITEDETLCQWYEEEINKRHAPPKPEASPNNGTPFPNGINFEFPKATPPEGELGPSYKLMQSMANALQQLVIRVGHLEKGLKNASSASHGHVRELHQELEEIQERLTYTPVMRPCPCGCGAMFITAPDQ